MDINGSFTPVQGLEAGMPVGQGVGGSYDIKSIVDIQQGIKRKFKKSKKDFFDEKGNLILAKGGHKDVRTDAFLYETAYFYKLIVLTENSDDFEHRILKIYPNIDPPIILNWKEFNKKIYSLKK